MTLTESKEIAENLANTPAAVRRLTEGLSEFNIRCKPTASEFSVVENVCHLRDIELDGYAVRIRRILLEDQPFLPDLDGSTLAVERDYNSQDLTRALEAFAQTRYDNVIAIRGLSAEQLERSGMFENSGVISLGRLVEMMLEHDEAHLHELIELTAKLAHSK